MPTISARFALLFPRRSAMSPAALSEVIHVRAHLSRLSLRSSVIIVSPTGRAAARVAPR